MGYGIGERLMVLARRAGALLVPAALATPAGDYYTQAVLEPDRIGCMWMIARHVDSTATFTLVARDSVPAGKLPLDVPTSRYRRYPRMSATMSVAHFNKVRDSGALEIGKIMNHIELDFWGAGKPDEVARLESAIWEIVRAPADTAEALRRAFTLLDSVAAQSGK